MRMLLAVLLVLVMAGAAWGLTPFSAGANYMSVRGYEMYLAGETTTLVTSTFRLFDMVSEGTSVSRALAPEEERAERRAWGLDSREVLRVEADGTLLAYDKKVICDCGVCQALREVAAQWLAENERQRREVPHTYSTIDLIGPSSIRFSCPPPEEAK